MTKERRIGIVLLAAGLLLAAFVGVGLVAHESRSLYFTVVFKNAEGLQKGDRVQLSGVNVGVVKYVMLHTQPTRIDVRVKIAPEHADKVRADATAIIRGQSLVNVSGQKFLEIVNAETDPPAPTMRDDAIVEGVEGAMGLKWWQTKKKWDGAADEMSGMLERVNESAKSVGEQVKQMATSPQVQGVMKKLLELLKTMKDKGIDAYQEVKERYPQLREEIQPVLKELQDFGRDYIVEQLKMIMEQIEELLERWRGVVEEKGEPTPEATPLETQESR